ncbi:MAG: ATP-dependent Clp protease ATP-binding subunit ClpA [Cellulosilyticaceae bacterium]
MNISSSVQLALWKAYEMAKNKNHLYLTPEHVLDAILNNQNIEDILIKLGANVELIKQNLENYLDETMEKGNGEEPIQTIGFNEIMLLASEQVISSGKTTMLLHHLLGAIFDLEESYAAYYLLDQGLSKRDILFALCHSDEEDNKKIKENKQQLVEQGEEPAGSVIKKYTTNITEAVKNENKDPLIGREDVLERTVQILSRRNKNNPIHVGEPGVGKTAIIFGLARKIIEGNVPKNLKDAQIYSLDIGGMIAGTKYRGDFEERFKNVLDQLKHKVNPIVYIDEIHNIVGMGSLGNGSLDASNLLKPYLMEGKIRFIGATTFEEYKKHFDKDKGLSRRFQTVEVSEPTVEESIAILKGIKSNYENYHEVIYTDEAIKSIVELSHKYINDKYLPDKAIDVLDEVGAFVKMKDKVVINPVVKVAEVEAIIAKICHIPKQSVEVSEVNALKTLEEELKKNIFGQNTAIEAVGRCIKISRAGLNEEHKPIASMLFVGPTGVGKTEIAKTLAKHLGIELVRFDMSEYAEKHDASKLIGSPPGYVGYEEGGLLTDAIRKKPHCVLLLDEVEKAHPDILSVLLQVMDYATLTDNQGRKADFRNVILIMTSNAGAKNIGKNLVGFGKREVMGEAVLEEVKKFFTPEFRNRLDKIVVFNGLDATMAHSIACKELEKFKQKLQVKNIKLSYNEAVVAYIAEKGTSKEFGAREILRLISTTIKPLLVNEILFGKLSEGGSCRLSLEKDKFKLTNVRKLMK